MTETEKKLRAALVGIVGCSTREEIAEMRLGVALIDGPDDGAREAATNALDILEETAES